MVKQKCYVKTLYDIIILSKVQTLKKKKLRPFTRGDVKKCYYFHSIKVEQSQVSQSCHS